MKHHLSLVAPLINKQDTNFRKSLSQTQRLIITVRFLASGDSQITLTYLFRMGKKRVSRIIRETCKALYEVLVIKYLSVPTTINQWKKISQDFEEFGKVPNDIGAIVGNKCLGNSLK